MNSFLLTLPWRIAAFAAIVVGVISFAGCADVWDGLIRVGAAFAIFFVLGLTARSVLSMSTQNTTSFSKSKPKVDAAASGRGGSAPNMPSDRKAAVTPDDMN